jgi:hypothetical protein
MACGIVIWSKRLKVVTTCGAATSAAVIVNGDQLFAVCSRHNARLMRAFPGMLSPDRKRS